MDWLERNLDAYRLVAEILNELRTTIRRDLEQIHGEQWFKTGLPDGLLGRLIEAKEEERAIDWYESEYQQVIDYAVFPDLLAILDHNGDHFKTLMSLAPSAALLHARFLELEVIRKKLGRTRPVSDGEIAFLGTFHTRFEKAVQSGTGDTPAPPAEPEPPAPPADELPAGDEAEDAAETPPTESAPTLTPAPVEAGDSEPSPTAPTRPPQRLARPAPTAGNTAPALDADADEDPQDGADDDAPPSGRTSLTSALENNDTRAVLRELYREVTAIADGIWSTSTPPSTPMWDTVSGSTWYEHNFSKLGLRPLSDFYEVISQVETRMEDGAGRDELQRFLKDTNFAQVLLSLRDMFQKAGI